MRKLKDLQLLVSMSSSVTQYEFQQRREQYGAEYKDRAGARRGGSGRLMAEQLSSAAAAAEERSEGYASEESEEGPEESFIRKISNTSEGYGSVDEKIENKKTEDAIFACQNLNLSDIKYFGFDMDYTLCEYLPALDEVTFELAKEWLVRERGHPAALLQLQYRAEFPVRGAWYDRHTGNLLRVGRAGAVLQALHGYRRVRPQAGRGDTTAAGS